VAPVAPVAPVGPVVPVLPLGPTRVIGVTNLWNPTSVELIEELLNTVKVKMGDANETPVTYKYPGWGKNAVDVSLA
jgi:hypothetical protein